MDPPLPNTPTHHQQWHGHALIPGRVCASLCASKPTKPHTKAPPHFLPFRPPPIPLSEPASPQPNPTHPPYHTHNNSLSLSPLHMPPRMHASPSLFPLDEPSVSSAAFSLLEGHELMEDDIATIQTAPHPFGGEGGWVDERVDEQEGNALLAQLRRLRRLRVAAEEGRERVRQRGRGGGGGGGGGGWKEGAPRLGGILALAVVLLALEASVLLGVADCKGGVGDEKVVQVQKVEEGGGGVLGSFKHWVGDHQQQQAVWARYHEVGGWLGRSRAQFLESHPPTHPPTSSIHTGPGGVRRVFTGAE